VLGRAALCGLLASVLMASPAHAGWLPPHTFATAPEPHEQGASATANASGRALVAWHSFDGFSDSVYVSERPPGATADWQSPRRLSTFLANAHYPRVALDDAGNAVVVWTLTYSEYFEVVQASIRLGPNGEWSSAAQISPPGEWSELAEVAFDNEGNLTAVWANITRQGVVQAAVYSTSSQTWSEPQTVSTPEMRNGPRLAVAPSGRAVVAWSTAAGGANTVLRASIRPSRTGTWLPERDVSTQDGSSSVNDIAEHASGQAIVIWDRFRATTDYVEVATLPAGSLEWGPPQRLNRAGTNGYNAKVAIDQDGNAVAAWHRDIDLRQDGIDASIRAAGEGGWSVPEAIAEHAFIPALTIDAAGDAVAVYGEIVGDTTIKARVRDARTGTWGPPSELSTPVFEAYPLAIAPDPSRGVIAVWQLHSAQCYCFTVQGADYVGRESLAFAPAAASASAQPPPSPSRDAAGDTWRPYSAAVRR
jgi:hypothetical protein